jgi:hypothetical protein
VHGECMDARVEAMQERLPDARVEAMQERLPDARVEATQEQLPDGLSTNPRSPAAYFPGSFGKRVSGVPLSLVTPLSGKREKVTRPPQEDETFLLCIYVADARLRLNGLRTRRLARTSKADGAIGTSGAGFSRRSAEEREPKITPSPSNR